MESKGKELEILILNDKSMLVSALEDIFSFGSLASLLAFNSFVLGNNWITTIFVLLIWLFWLKGRSLSKKFKSWKEVEDYAKERQIK